MTTVNRKRRKTFNKLKMEYFCETCGACPWASNEFPAVYRSPQGQLWAKPDNVL